jgi:hypothetical protein
MTLTDAVTLWWPLAYQVLIATLSIGFLITITSIISW